MLFAKIGGLGYLGLAGGLYGCWRLWRGEADGKGRSEADCIRLFTYTGRRQLPRPDQGRSVEKTGAGQEAEGRTLTMEAPET